LDRGSLRLATWLAADVAAERGKPIDLEIALRFLPLVATQQPQQYDAYGLRWLKRWIKETSATIDAAADLATALAELPMEPVSALEAIRSRVR
jgi:hypothetical protein